MNYIQISTLIIELFFIYSVSAMEIYTATNLKSPSNHTPIAHLRSLEGKERKEFMLENEENISYFIQKTRSNTRKIQRKLDNYPEQQFIGNILTLTSIIAILGSGHQLLHYTHDPTKIFFGTTQFSGILIGIITGLSLGYFGIKKIHQNSPITFHAMIRKNNEVIHWLNHNGYYNKKEN